MLKKSLVAIVVMGMCVCTASAAVDTDTANVELTILAWVSIDFNDVSPDHEFILSTDGTASDDDASDTVTYSATGNADANITIAVTQVPNVPSLAPGSWSASVDDSTHTAGGTTNGTATVSVTGLANEDAGTYTGGVCTITITSI